MRYEFTHCSTLLRLGFVASLRDGAGDVSLCLSAPVLREEAEPLATPTESCSTC